MLSQMNDSQQTRGSEGLSGDLDMTRMEWELLAFDISWEFGFRFAEGQAGISSLPGNRLFVSSAGLERFTGVDLSFHLLFVVPLGVCFCQSCTSHRLDKGLAWLWVGDGRWGLQQHWAGAALGARAVVPSGIRSPGTLSHCHPPCACPTLPPFCP